MITAKQDNDYLPFYQHTGKTLASRMWLHSYLLHAKTPVNLNDTFRFWSNLRYHPVFYINGLVHSNSQ